jgi:hypothetical protein
VAAVGVKHAPAAAAGAAHFSVAIPPIPAVPARNLDGEAAVFLRQLSLAPGAAGSCRQRANAAASSSAIIRADHNITGSFFGSCRFAHIIGKRANTTTGQVAISLNFYSSLTWWKISYSVCQLQVFSN